MTFLEENISMKKKLVFFSILLTTTLFLAACGGTAEEEPTDLLAQIQARGTLLVATDPNYEPQSFLDPAGVRPEGTKCGSEELTLGEMVGFDVDAAVAIADALGVEACFVTPDWDVVTAGSWADRWDISVGSMTVTRARQEALTFTTPYYYTPAQFAASSASGITSIADLNGQAICMGTATTYEDWLNGVDLGLPETSMFAEPPTDIEIVALPTDQECAQSIQAGREEFSVYLTSDTVINSNIENGLDVVKVGSAVFSENLAPAIDNNTSLDASSFIAAVDDAVKAMHADGTLRELSLTWFGVDLTSDPTK